MGLKQKYLVTLKGMSSKQDLALSKVITFIADQLRQQGRRSSNPYRYAVALEVLEGKCRPAFGFSISRLTGAKSFFVRVSLPTGRRQRFTLGRFPAVGLAQARKRARAVLTETDRGRDLAGEAKERREAPTFEELAEAFLNSPRMLQRAERTRAEYKRILDFDLLPAWKRRKAHELGKADVAALLDKVLGRGGMIMANRTRALMSVIFNFALDRSLVESNPALAVRKPAPERRRDRMLSDSQIQPFWKLCEADNSVAGRVLQFLLLTGQRRGEAMAAKWEHILDEDLWLIPAESTKSGRAHAVPLSPQAVAVLEPLQKLGSEWVFPSPRKSGRHLVNVSDCTARIAKGLEQQFSPHDLRRTLATGCAQLGFSSDTLGRLLNHAPSGVLAAYDHGDRAEDVRRALFAWGAKVERLVKGEAAKVVKMA